MSVEKRLFLGIKQMTQTAFSELQDSEKVGYIWFVRCEDPVHFEIYLGTKKYGETNETVEQFIREIAEKLRAAIGLNEDLTLPEDFQYQDLIAALNDHGVRISEIEEKIVGLFKFKGVFDTLTELFASGETVDGYVYQVVYRDIEQNEEGEWVPVIPPILVNSEFVWDGDEWVELGPLFDERELDEIREILSAHTECLESMNVISDEFIYNLFNVVLKRLTINVTGGEYASKTGEGEYAPGERVYIGVEPADGYAFIKWNDNERGKNRPVVVSKNDEENVHTATLTPNESACTISVEVYSGQEEMGTAYAAIINGEEVSSVTAMIGETIAIHASGKDSRYKFKCWKDEDGGEISHDAIYDVIIEDSEDIKLYATFEDSGFDTILNIFDNDFPEQTETYDVEHEWERSGVTYGSTWTKIVYSGGDRGATDKEESPYFMNNSLGWEGSGYTNLIYTESDPASNIVLVLRGEQSSSWNVTHEELGKFTVNGLDGIDQLVFNYGYFHQGDRKSTESGTLMPDLHLVVKIYSVSEDEETFEKTYTLERIYKINRTYYEWGYVNDEDYDTKLHNRPFKFDSMSEEDLKYGESGELNIEGEYHVEICNYFDKTDLRKEGTEDEYYGDNTFDGESGTGDYVVPKTRMAIDNVEVSLSDEKRRSATRRNKKEKKQ